MSFALSFAENAVKRAEMKGAEQAEAFVVDERSVYITVELGEVKFRSSGLMQGLGLSVLSKKSLGFSFTTALDEKGLDRTIIEALRAASIKAPDPDFQGFPEARRVTTETSAYDKALAEMDYSLATDLASRMTEAAQEIDRELIPTFGVVQSSERSKAVANSTGLKAQDRGTLISAGLRTLLKKGSKTSNGYDFQSSRVLKELQPEAVGAEAGRLAQSSLDTRDIRTCRTTVILEPHAVAGVFGVLGQALSGDAVAERRSVLADMLGREIGCNIVTVLDDGTFENGFATAAIDDEGVPMMRKAVVEKGVLKSYLYNSYAARKEGVESTGNAVRSGAYSSGRGAFRNTPRIGITNLVIGNGSMTREELIEDTKDGILVTFAVGGGSAVTGDFSTDIRNGFKIEDGEVAYALTQGMYTGNILTALKNVEGLSRQRRFSGGLSPGKILGPTMKISDGQIIGST